MVVYREGLTRIVEEELFENLETAKKYQEKIKDFRNKGYKAIYDVAVFLKEIIEKNHDKSKVSPTINSRIISKIIFDDYEENHIKNILKIIEREYGSMLDFFEKEDFLKYNFDFYEKFKKQGIAYSLSDVRRQIIVPEKPECIDYFILGVIAGDGRIDSYGKDNYLVILQGERADYNFYKKILKNIISDRFNITAELMDFKKHGVRIDLSSRILYSWVERHLNFPKNKRYLEFKINSNENHKFAFLLGLIETTAKVEKIGIILEHRYKRIINSISKLLNDLKINHCFGYKILDYRKPYNIIIPKNDVLKINKLIKKQEFLKEYYRNECCYFLNEKFAEKLEEYRFVQKKR